MQFEFNVDSHFVIGKKHLTQNTPCQDHALSGMIKDMTYIVISDGCSSGRHTDIGARIVTCSLTQSIKKILHDFHGDIMMLPDLIHKDIFSQSQLISAAMGLDNQDLLATCVYAVITPAGGFIHMLGDGSTIVKSKNNDLIITTLEWQHNTPYYVADNRKELFIAEHMRTEMGEKSMLITQSYVSGDQSFSEKSYFSIHKAVQGYIIPISEEYLETIEAIIVCSDGVERFKKGIDLADSVSIISGLVSFKNYTGEFMKRRLSRGLSEYLKQGLVNDDDVAMAAIHIAHDKIVSNE